MGWGEYHSPGPAESESLPGVGNYIIFLFHAASVGDFGESRLSLSLVSVAFKTILPPIPTNQHTLDCYRRNSLSASFMRNTPRRIIYSFYSFSYYFLAFMFLERFLVLHQVFYRHPFLTWSSIIRKYKLYPVFCVAFWAP